MFITSWQLKPRHVNLETKKILKFRYHIDINCPHIRLQEHLFKKPNLTLQKMQICCTVDIIKELIKLLRLKLFLKFAGAVTAAVYSVERNHTSHDQRGQMVQPRSSCNRCGKEHTRDLNTYLAIGKQCTKLWWKQSFFCGVSLSTRQRQLTERQLLTLKLEQKLIMKQSWWFPSPSSWAAIQ